MQTIGAEDDSGGIHIASQAPDALRAAISDKEPGSSRVPDFGSCSARGVEEHCIKRGAPNPEAEAGKRGLDTMRPRGEADGAKGFARCLYLIAKAKPVKFSDAKRQKTFAADFAPGKGVLLDDDDPTAHAREVDGRSGSSETASDNDDVVHGRSIAAD